jgi:hypothetical protein
MTVLLLIVPPALCNVEPKMAKNMIGAMKLLRAKKYWTLRYELNPRKGRGGTAEIYLSVRYTEEGQLKQEVEHKANHSRRGDALTLGDVVFDVGKAWPDRCEQNCHALAASRGLHTVNI